MSSGSPIISVRDLKKTYRDGLLRRRSVEALRGVTLDVARGEIFGLLGPNGAGKTTLIKVLLGIVRKTEGEAMLLGQPAGTRHVRRRIGYLPEGHQIPRHLTGNTALEYYGCLSGLSARDVRARRGPLLERVGLSDWGRVSVRKYSKGMKQRLGVAQAMIHQPDVVILDEPTDGVDPVGRAAIRDILRELQRAGTTVFLNSHLLQEIELICDRVAILGRGRVVRVGRISELTDEWAEQSTVVTFEVRAPEASIRETLGDLPVQDWSPRPQGLRFRMAAADTQQVNAVIDRLRNRQIEILSVTRSSNTLEQAFLRLVQSGSMTP